MIKFSTPLKAIALSACAMVAANASADDAQKYYLTDVYTVEDLTSDVFGVPMRIDHVDGGKYVARYFNEKANNEVYVLGTKTDFSDVVGAAAKGASGELSMGSSLGEVEPFVLPEANKYYEIALDLDAFTYEVKTFEPADYMNPVLWELNSEDGWNVWSNFTYDAGADTWMPGDDAWCRPFYFGYTCSEYLLNDNNEYVNENGDVVMYDKEAGIDERVMAKKPLHINEWAQDENGDWYDTGNPQIVNAEQLRWCELWTANPVNKYQYTFNQPKHLVAGQKMNFIVHNWHEAGWWNEVTWRVDDEEECDIFYYYGNKTSQAYLDYVYGAGTVTATQWNGGEDIRKDLIYGGGSDCWCKPTVQTTGDYLFTFDVILGRGKMVPATGNGGGDNGIQAVAADENAPVEYYNMQGILMRGDNLPAGLYIKRQGKTASKVLVK